MREFTPLQRFIIPRVTDLFKSPEKLKEIYDEYNSIYHSDLKEDYEYLCSIWNKALGGNNERQQDEI